MKRITIIIVLSITMLIMACGGGNTSKPTEINPRDTVKVPETLSGEDSIAYIEDAIFQSPITAEQLLSLNEMHSLDDWLYNVNNGEYREDTAKHIVTYRDSCATRLANRFIRMFNLVYYNGKALDKLQMALAVNVILDTFRAEVPDLPRDSAIYEIERVVSKYSTLTQSEMNSMSSIDASVEYYQTIEAYRQWLSEVPANLYELAVEEYVAWHDLNEARFMFWRDVSYRQEWYSMKPMEIAIYNSVLSRNRRAELKIERNIVLHAKPYRQLGRTVTTRQWEAWIAKKSIPEDADLLREMEAEDRYMPSEKTVTESVNRIRSTFKRWLAARQALAAALPEAQGKSYDNLTADMHARLIETLPSIEPIPDFLYF